MIKTRTIRGEEYRLVVFKVTGRYPDGRPKECIMVHDDQKTDVQDGTEFITGFVLAKTVAKARTS